MTVNNDHEERPVIKSRVEVIESILPFVDSPPPIHSGLENATLNSKHS